MVHRQRRHLQLDSQLIRPLWVAAALFGFVGLFFLVSNYLPSGSGDLRADILGLSPNLTPNIATGEPKPKPVVQVFKDVRSNDPFGFAIQFLNKNKILNGYKDNTFKPGNFVNRAEFVKIMVQAVGYIPAKPLKPCFGDVPVDAWYAPYVCFVKDQGWVKGYSDGNFRPSQTISKAEALKILGDAQEWNFALTGQNRFDGLNPYLWYTPYVRYADSRNFLPDTETALTFKPGDPLTRGYLSESIYRALTVRQLDEDKYSKLLDDKIFEQQLVMPPLTPLEPFDEIISLPGGIQNIQSRAPDSVLVASNAPLLVADNKCDTKELLKKALQMLKESCYEDGLISEDIKNLDLNNLGDGTQVKNSPFMGGNNKDYTKWDLGSSIELRLGQNSSVRKKGITMTPSTRDGKAILEINMSQVGCDPEYLKVVLFHELIHEQQIRRTGYGYWNADGTMTQPASQNEQHDGNHLSPRALVDSCMEFEAHMLTARCIQIEQRIPAYDQYKRTMDKLLEASKDHAKEYLLKGEGGKAACLPYLKRMRGNLSANGQSVAGNAEWTVENRQIWDNYLSKWWDRIQELFDLFYEKFFIIPRATTTRQNDSDNRFRVFLRSEFNITDPNTIKGIIDEGTGHSTTGTFHPLAPREYYESGQ